MTEVEGVDTVNGEKCVLVGINWECALRRKRVAARIERRR